MQYDECINIINQFKEKYPEFLIHPNFCGLEIGLSVNESPEIQVCVVIGELDSFKKSYSYYPKTFEYKCINEKNNKTIEVNYIEKRFPIAQCESIKGDDLVRAGDMGSAFDLNGFGTAGWTFFFSRRFGRS